MIAGRSIRWLLGVMDEVTELVELSHGKYVDYVVISHRSRATLHNVEAK